jgi:hypothetical protein
MSAMPITFLMGEWKWKRLSAVNVSRSELFVRDFVRRAGGMPPREEIAAWARPLPAHETFFFDALDGSYPETIGRFNCRNDCVPLAQSLESGEIDVIVMDNMLETYTSALSVETPSGERFVSVLPFNLCENADEIYARNHFHIPPVSAAESMASWREIISFFRAAAPRADLVFACSPLALAVDNPERYARSRDFYPLLRDEADALGVHVIPPLDVDVRFTKLPQDNSHFDNIVYRAMAGHIVLSHIAKLSSPGQRRPVGQSAPAAEPAST